MFAIPFPMNCKTAATNYGSITLNSVVNAGVVVGSILYLAGGFTSVGDASSATIGRTCLAAIDLTTGRFTSWNPNANVTCHDICYYNGSIYVAGDFTTVGGTSKSAFAKIDATTGVLDTGFTVSASQGRVILNAGTSIYLAANNSVAIAKVNATTGANDGSWAPTGFTAASVNDMAASSTHLYVVGGFATTIQGSTRNRACSLDLSTAALGTWDPSITVGNAFVVAVDESAGYVYVGGAVTTVASATRRGVFQSGLTGTGVNTWAMDAMSAPNVTANVLALYGDGTDVYIGGAFILLDGPSSTRNRIGKGDGATGTLASFNPSITTASSNVNDIMAGGPGGTIIAVGDFLTVNGSSRSRVAFLDPTTGVPL